MSCENNCYSSPDGAKEVLNEEFINGKEVVDTLTALKKYFETRTDVTNPLEIITYFELISTEIQRLQKEFEYNVVKQLFKANNQDLDEYLKDTTCKHVNYALNHIEDEKLKKLLRGLFE